MSQYMKMTTTIVKKKYGTTPGFVVITALVTREELNLLKQVQKETKRNQKELFRAAIRWLPKTDRAIDCPDKDENSESKLMSLEVTPSEKAIVKAIATSGKMTTTDVIRWIIHNLDWIAKEV